MSMQLRKTRGRAASSFQGRSDSICTTPFTLARVYSAELPFMGSGDVVRAS
jgi:hypothetical protein